MTDYSKKVKWSHYRPGVAQRVGLSIALLFHDRDTRRGEWSAARPGRNLPSGKTRYPLYRRQGGPQGWSGRAENLTPTGIRSVDRPTGSESLYRLSYRAHLRSCYTRIYGEVIKWVLVFPTWTWREMYILSSILVEWEENSPFRWFIGLDFCKWIIIKSTDLLYG